jgi:ankyrin repeat protein
VRNCAVVATALLVLFSALLSSADAAHVQTTGTPFYQAIRNNDISVLRDLIRSSGVDTRDRRGTTPLMYAAAVGSLDAMKRLLEAGADVNAKNAFDATALMWAAGDIGKVRLLLAKGADVNARSKIGRTPLLIAALHDGASEIVRLMIEKGADVKARDESGLSVLEAAAFSNDAETARLLLAKGADPNAKDATGLTPLLAAAWNGDRNTEIVRLLLRHGANVNAVCVEAVDSVKNGPVAIGLLTPLLSAAPYGNYETVSLLVNAGANVNAKDVRGMTPLALTVSSDRPDPRIVRLFLSKGADPAIKSKNGETAADRADKYRNADILAALGARRKTAAAIPVSLLPVNDDAGNVKVAVEKGVAKLQKSAAKFLDAGGCVACHAQNLTGLAVQAARARGAKVDLSLEVEQAKMVASLAGGLEQKLLQLVDTGPGVEGIEYSILHMGAAGISPGPEVDAIVVDIAAGQRREGDWPNYGTVRPPLEDGSFAHTAMGIRSLQLYFIPGRKTEFDDRIARAAAWLRNANPRSTDDRVMQLLGIHWAGGKPPEERVKELIALERPDGGWGQTNNLPSDAYATGQALYALHEIGVPTGDVWRRGIRFLLRTQLEDGSWHVKTRAAGFQPYFQSGFPHEHDQWISAAGTAWATMALASAIPKEVPTLSRR